MQQDGPGPGPSNLGPPVRVCIGRLSGVGALWDCAPRVCGGGGGCAGGDVPLSPRCPGVRRCLSQVNISSSLALCPVSVAVGAETSV